MSKTRRWVIILLALVTLVLIGVNLADRDDTQAEVVNTSDPTYKSDHSDPDRACRNDPLPGG